MTLICLEGIDGIGKTTLINQLVKKHPHLNSMAFPTTVFKQEIDDEVLVTPVSPNIISTLIHYHTAFELDFMQNDYVIAKAMENRPLLLDRYFLSNWAYAEMNFKKHGYENHPFISLLHKIEHSHVPSLVIFLKALDVNEFPPKEDSHFTIEELSEIQKNYEKYLYGLRINSYIKEFQIITLPDIETRDVLLFNQVEQLLLRWGLLYPHNMKWS